MSHDLLKWSNELQSRLIAASSGQDDDVRNLLGEAACCLAALSAQPPDHVAESAAEDAKRERDTKRLDALAKNYWKLDPFERPTGGDDSDVGWRAIQYHMDKPHERIVAEVFVDDPRAAIDAAMGEVDDQ